MLKGSQPLPDSVNGEFAVFLGILVCSTLVISTNLYFGPGNFSADESIITSLKIPDIFTLPNGIVGFFGSVEKAI